MVSGFPLTNGLRRDDTYGFTHIYDLAGSQVFTVTFDKHRVVYGG